MSSAPEPAQERERWTQRLIGWVLRYPARAVALTLAVGAVAALVASGLRVPVTQALLVRPGSDVGRATTQLERSFGSEPIVVSLRGPLASTTLTPDNVRRMLHLETLLGRLAGVQSVYGPGTFFNSTVAQFARILQDTLGAPAKRADAAARRARAQARARGAGTVQADQIGEQARLDALGPLQDEFSSLVVRFGSVGFPSLGNRNFLLTLAFGSGTEPKARFRQLFPDANHAVIAVRLRPGLGDQQVRRLGRLITAQVRAAHLADIDATVGGSPLVAASLSRDMRVELMRLGPVVVVVMAATLAAALGAGLHILALVLLGLLSTVLTAAAVRLLGVGLSPGTLAALPVVFGLALDYAIQLLVRVRHLAPERGGRRRVVYAAVEQVGPALRLAGAAMTLGFLTLLTSAAPLLRDLGATLVVGTVVSLVLVLGVGGPLLVLADRHAPVPRAWRGLRLPAPAPVVQAALAALALGLVLAGLVLGARVSAQSDPTKLGRANSAELTGVRQLQHELGTVGQLRVRVAAKDVTLAPVLNWMASAQRRILKADPGLRPGPNPAELLAGDAGRPLAQADVDRLLGLLPRYILDAVFSRDHHIAELSFGLPLSSIADQHAIVERADRVLEDAPRGIDAEPAGLIAAASSSVGSLGTARSLLFPFAVVVVVLFLLAVRRRWDRAIVPVLPALITSGFSGLLIAVGGIHPTPLTVALEPLVLAVGVEFGVLLESSYQQLRRAGHGPDAACALARQRVGRAVATSAAAVAVGFAGLAVSRLHVLAQFGLLAAIEVVVCAGAAIFIVPAMMAASDDPGRTSAPDGDDLVSVEELPHATTC